MKLVRFGPLGQEQPGVLHGDEIIEVSSVVSDFDQDFWARGGVALLRDAAAGALPRRTADDVRLGPPLPRPGKIVCVGLNYADHAAEAGAEPPDEPVLFLKASSTWSGPDDDVWIPPGSEYTDWEVELAVVIGSQARYLDDHDEAAAAIAGYAISNDVSERHYQLERGGGGGQWDKGKSCETFNPFGPWLVTADEVEPDDLALRLWVNDTLRQDGTTAQMIFPIASLVHHISQFMVLEPGDVINTGTPAGVAHGDPGIPFLQDGDSVEVEIEGLGRQRQRFVGQ